ncbi:hypothetical protein E1A91_D06G067000v1 [Gossypium mustelinum]|uniref:Ribosomal protein eL8/eL30/eS12/Gadd45 domain-containing protein n=1 Tax=Gossypium mustelinum TaxID=34275 RepID=A0A5D2UFA5_GOSMU|nr:hypothetical protein E1A91_D06G067000v1 [Gossypium mustelinum]
MVAAKKTKKTHESINTRLALVMKSGKYTLGYKTVLKSLRSSKGKLIIIANNCLLLGSRRSSIMPCCAKLEFTTTMEAENDAVGQELQKQLEAAGTFPPSFLQKQLEAAGTSFGKVGGNSKNHICCTISSREGT